MENIPSHQNVGLQCELEHFNDRNIFMSMYKDIAWRVEGNTGRCEYNSQTVANNVSKFPRGHLVFLGAWVRKNGTEPTLTNPTEPGTKLQRI